LSLPTYCKTNSEAHKNANSIKELVELLTNIELVDVDSVNVLSIIDSITLLTKSLTTLINDAELVDKISHNSAKNNIKKIIFDNKDIINHLRKTIYPALLTLPAGKIIIETPTHLTQAINFDVSKLESSELLALVQQNPSSLFFMLKNKSDLDVYAYYLAQSLYNNKKVYKADLFVIASAALGYGLNKDQFIDFMVSIIKEVGSSVVILNNLSSLSSDENLITDNLQSLLSKLSGVTILVPIGNDSSLKNNSYFSSKFSDFSSLTLPLSKAILNELIIATEPEKTKEDILATAKVIRALSPEKYSLGALYEIWQSYKKNPALTQKELVIDVSNKLAGISDKDISKKGLLELSWDYVEGLVQKDTRAFSTYKKPKNNILQQQIFGLKLANITTQVKDAGNKAINDLNKKTAANVAQINTAKTGSLGEIETSKNNAFSEINDTSSKNLKEINDTSSKHLKNFNTNLKKINETSSKNLNNFNTVYANKKKNLLDEVNSKIIDVNENVNNLKKDLDGYKNFISKVNNIYKEIEKQILAYTNNNPDLIEYLKSIIENFNNLDIDGINQKINDLYTKYNVNITVQETSSDHLKNFNNLYSRKEKKLSKYVDKIKKDLEGYKNLISEAKNIYNEIKKDKLNLTPINH
jgi:hypothetical protein